MPFVFVVNFDLVFTFEETRHATAATVVIESSCFDEEEVLYNTKYRELLKLWHPETHFGN